MPDALSLDEFMTHSTTAARGSFLRGWKDRNPPTVNTVLHTRNSIYVTYRHEFPKIVVREKEKDRVVWPGNYVCHEEEKLIKDQFKRDDDGMREYPPSSCGACKLIEWTYQQVLDKKLSWVEPIFRFEADDPKATKTLHAGGITNIFGRRDLSDSEKEDMKKHGIFMKDAWAQACWAKAKYLFLVVDYDDVAAGVQIAIESSLLGNKVRGVIADKRASDGKDEGDPFKNPYVIQWEFNPAKNCPINEKYKARAIAKFKVTEREDLMALIHDSPPSVDNILKPFDPIDLRTALEEAALIEFPWDDFFGPVEQAESPAREKSNGASTPDVSSKAGQVSTGAAKVASKPSVEYGPDDPECPECDKPVKDDDKKCPHCGAVFEADEPPPPPPPPRRKKGVQPTAPVQAASKPAPKADPKKAGSSAFPDDGDDIPF